MQEMFKSLDTDHSGTLSLEELLRGFSLIYNKKLFDLETDIDRIMQAADIDKSNS